MTMNSIFRKLRSGSKKQYRLLGFCIFLSVFLISSFSFMYFGPTVQDFLPEGGDTRKLAVLLLGVTVAGCCIFTVYASSLFFRFKSREYGIFLALGEPKKNLRKVLFYELSLLCAFSSLLGIVLGIPASFFIWKLFESFLISNSSTAYRFGIGGLLAGFTFALLLAVLLGIMGRRFIKQTNIIDLLRAGQKTEMVKEIKPYAFSLGIVLIIAGLGLGLGLNPLIVRLFKRAIPGTGLFYLLALAGIYLVLLSIVSQSKLGRNKKKFYKNMVSVSMMRFSAKSATRNMCVIVLLLFSCMASAFYGMLYTNSADFRDSSNLRSFAMHYPKLEKQLTKEDITAAAKKHSVTLKDFGEEDASNLVISYKKTDYADGKYFNVNAEKAKLALFLSDTAYNALTGQDADVSPGNYKTVTPADYKESIWEFTDGLYAAMNPDTGKSLSLSYGGSLESGSIYAMSSPYAYVINDKDYKELSKGLTADYKEHILLFDVKDFASSYDFAKDLFSQYVSRSGNVSCHIENYDAWEEHLALQQSEEYGYSMKPDLSADVIADWKYAPQFSILTKQNHMQLICIYVMLCLYIFIICLSAAAIMNYVRSVSIAENNKSLFDSLERLGADDICRISILKSQLSKIFQYPAVLGCVIGLLFPVVMCFNNDGRFTADELHTLAVMFGIASFIFAFMYIIYCFSKSAAQKIIRL